MELDKPSRPVSLFKAIQIGRLRDEDKQDKVLQRYGYQIDRRISDGRQTLVAYNPRVNKVLFVANGTDTKSEKDLITDFVLAQGGLKETRRYRETKQAYDQAKEKYRGAKFTDVGYSLGGALVNQIASPNDRALVYNGAYTPRQKIREHVRNVRVRGDWISGYSPPATTTLVPPIEIPSASPFLKEHRVEHIKELAVFI
jgi:hypothetical protein